MTWDQEPDVASKGTGPTGLPPEPEPERPRNPGPGPRCRSCGAEIVWLVVRPGGRRMPVDREPAPDGTVLVDFAAGAGVVFTKAAREAFRANEAATGVEPEPLYRSHFATCPQAGEWRR